MKFIRYSKQWYWKTNQPAEDDILIQIDNGEFVIRQIAFQDPPELAIKLDIFDDQIHLLKNDKLVNALVALSGITTLDEVELVLKKHGFKEEIAKER